MLIINFEGREAKGLWKGRYDETFAGEDAETQVMGKRKNRLSIQIKKFIKIVSSKISFHLDHNDSIIIFKSMCIYTTGIKILRLCLQVV